jgi:hypothetical protein
MAGAVTASICISGYWRHGRGSLCIEKGLPGILCEHATWLGQLNPASAAFEQLDPKFLFEIVNLLTKGGLCHMDPFGGTSKVHFGYDGKEVAHHS